MATLSPAKLPHARRGFDRQIVHSDDPEAVLRRHRTRIRDMAEKLVAPNHLFEYAEREMRMEAEDLLSRRIIRPATASEISRIRSSSRG